MSKVITGVVVVVLLVAAGFVGWFLHDGTGGDGDVAASSASASDEIKVGVPTIVSPDELEDYAKHHQPLYWAGERPDTKIELTRTDHNGTFVRYLPKDAKAGDEKQYLTVGTYDAFEGYEGLAGAKKGVADVEHGKQGAVITVFKKKPLSTYFSFKNAAFQVEVFSPTKGESKKLTDNGTVTLVGAGS